MSGTARLSLISGETAGDTLGSLPPSPPGVASAPPASMASDDFSSRWEQRIRDHGHPVFLSLLALGVTPETAREVVQATWARLMEKDRAGDLHAGSFLGLAITQARFIALDMRRAQARRGSHEPVEDHHELPASPASNPEELAVSRQELERVRLALARCPASVQKVFRLAYTPPPRDHRQIAETVGLSVQRVRQILSDTRKRLRTAIEQAPEPEETSADGAPDLAPDAATSGEQAAVQGDGPEARSPADPADSSPSQPLCNPAHEENPS